MSGTERCMMVEQTHHAACARFKRTSTWKLMYVLSFINTTSLLAGLQQRRG